jgi:MSHA biogenesis protein MshG
LHPTTHSGWVSNWLSRSTGQPTNHLPLFIPVIRQRVLDEEQQRLQEIAEMYEREVDYEIKTLAARIEPLIIVAMGAMVLALGVCLPMWDLGSKALHH